LTGEVRTGQENLAARLHLSKTHYVMPQETTRTRNRHDQKNCPGGKRELEKQGKFVESQRVVQRTMFDIEMMRTIGYCMA